MFELCRTNKRPFFAVTIVWSLWQAPEQLKRIQESTQAYVNATRAIMARMKGDSKVIQVLCKNPQGMFPIILAILQNCLFFAAALMLAIIVTYLGGLSLVPLLLLLLLP